MDCSAQGRRPVAESSQLVVAKGCSAQATGLAMEDKIRAGSVLRGRYRILHPLGEGGFGVTYKAVDQDTFDSPCVVKRLRPLSTDPYTLATARKLFEREAKVLNRLNHFDQVPRLLAHFEQDQDFYLVQEFVAGHDLSQELIPGKPLSEAEVLKLLWDILEILRHVHAHQIVHRDIKPANLMRRDADGKLVLIDFGAVKEVGRLVSHAPGQTQLATVIGSVGYMAPEQLNGKPQPCSDLYSVGVLAIQALTGRPPHKIRDDPRTGQLIWRDLVQVSEELAEILDRLICPHWQERFQSAAEVLEALRPLLPFPQEATLGDVAVDQVLVTRLLARAQEKARQGDFQGAIADCTLAIQLDPQNSRAYSQRGSARYKSGDLAGAIADYTQVIQLAGDARAYFNRGIARYRLEDYEGAVADYTQALGLNPQWAVAYYNRGNAYRQLNQQQQAIEDYSRAIELNPEDVRAYFNRGVVRGHLGDAQGAAADFSEVIKRDPQDGEAYFNRGVARVQLSDLQGAVEDYTQALQLDPRHGKAYYHRGLARQALGDPQGAVEDFSQALSLRSAEATELPEAEAAAQADLYLQRAMAYLSSNTLESALADCEQALRLDPKLSRAYLCRGLARQGLGDPGGALADFNRALELDPQMAKAYLNRGIAHLDLGNIEAALSDLNQAIALDPQDASAYSSRGRIHWLLGDPLAALQDYTAALERDPQNPQLYFNRGQLHAEREDWPAACEDFSQVLQWAARPGIPRGPELLLNAHLCRGMARQRLGDWQGALADFDQALQGDPQSGLAYFHRGQVRAALGDGLGAIQDYHQALALGVAVAEADIRRDLARAQIQTGDLQAALEQLNEAVRLQPERRDLRQERAELCRRLGRWPEAIADYDEVLRQDPQDWTAWLRRGMAHGQVGNWAAALQDLSRVLQQDPDHREALWHRGQALQQLGQTEAALQDLNRLLQRDPQHRMARLARGSLLLALAVRGTDGPTNRAEQDRVSGTESLELGYYAQAESDFDQVIQEEAQDGEQSRQLYLEAHLKRAQVRRLRHNLEGAIADWDRVLELASPGDPEVLVTEALLYRGLCRQERGDLAGALADFTALIQQQPQASQAFALRARVHLALGDQEAALADLNQALSLDQNWGVADAALAYRQRGDLHRQANCPELAIADYTQALALNPQEHSALLHRALLWDGEGQTDKAIEDYTRLLQLELDPQERVWVLNNRGWAYAQQGDFSAAIRDYDQAITLCTADASDRDPCHLKAHLNRALARAALGDWQRACQDFQAALQMQGYEGRLLEDVIASYFKIG